jgi:hypothetical protein
VADVYDAYKPLRNNLRNVDLINGLGAVRWYINYSQMKTPLPPPRDMEVEPLIYDKKGFTIFLPWQLAVLSRELIINSPLEGYSKDLRKKRDLASALNKVKAIDDYIGEHFVNQSNIMHVVSKVMAHQQFVWQENRPNHQTWNRYYYIYQHKDVRPIFEKYFGISVEVFYCFSMIAWHNYTQFLGLNYPPNIQMEKIGATLDDYKLFIKNYALPLDELRTKLTDKAERHIDYDFFYYYDSLKKYPLILTKIDGQDTHICPIPTYLYWRTTDGVYYELLGQKGFDQALGEAFKTYIGEVINKQKYSRSLVTLDGDTFIAKGLPKPDWIMIDTDTALFIECKSKRMTIDAKNEHSFTPVTEAQLQKLAESVIQCYKALIDALQRKYTELSKVKNFYPMVVTLETWYIVGDIAAKLKAEVLKEASKAKIGSEIIEKYPYIVVSAHEFENSIIIIRNEKLGTIIPPFFDDKQYDEWQFDTYLSHVYPKTIGEHKLFDKNFLTEAIEKIVGYPIES